MRLFRRKKKIVSDEGDKSKLWKGCYTPIYNHDENLWGVETYSGTYCGDLSYISYMTCGITMSFPYHHGDGAVGYAENFEQILSALNRNPEMFSIQGYESKYSDQERRLLAALQEVLLQIKQTGRPLTREETEALRGKYRSASVPSTERK